MARRWLDPPPPPRPVQLYDRRSGALLEEQVYPFEEKAIELYIANADRAASGIYDVWVEKSFDRLARLVPGRYAKSERSEDVIRLFD